MKSAKTTKRTISLLLVLTMLLGMLPTTAFATEADNAPDVLEYKGMSMVNQAGGQWVSRYEFNTSTNIFHPFPVSFAPGRTLTKIAYTIEKGQSVSFELYRYNGPLDHHEEGGSTWDSATMEYSTELVDPENDPYTTKLEKFLGERIGYLSGVVVRDNIELTHNPPDVDPEAKPKEITDEQWRDIVLDAWNGGDIQGKTSLADVYAYGWQGQKLRLDPPAGASLSLMVAGEEPVASSTETTDSNTYIISDDVKVKPVVEDEAPAETEAPAESEAPVESEAPAETEAPAESEAPAETEAPAESEAPVETEVPAETEAPAESEAPTKVIPEYTEEQILAVQMQMEASTFDLVADRDFIQNYFLWDGSVVDGSGNPIDFEYTTGHYVIVMTPTNKIASMYNSFLGFEVKMEQPLKYAFAAFLEALKELLKNWFGDPVNMVTGSFSWNYTDMSLYGKNNLPFIRYYESVDAENNYGLGNGWTSNYTAELEVQTLFARVTLPGSNQIFFDLNPDGSYRPVGDYTFAWTGNGYILTNEKEKTVFSFDKDRHLRSISYLDGNVVTLSWSGEQMTSISNDTGSFALSYNADGNLETITDNVGRTVEYTYDGDYLTSAQNPDEDDLIYTYTANGLLETVKNFKGQLYVDNTYDEAGRVIHQYAPDIGTFDFTYDVDSRHTLSTSNDGNFMGIWYNEQGWITRRDDPQGSLTFTWDDLGHKTSETDREGNTTRYDHETSARSPMRTVQRRSSPIIPTVR